MSVAFIIWAVLLLLFAAVAGRFLALWWRARAGRAGVTMADLIGMSLRKVDPRVIVASRTCAVRAGLEIPARDMENHFLAGGDVPKVITAMILAREHDAPLSWRTATAIDLAGRDIIEAVRNSFEPRVVDCRDRQTGEDTIRATTSDGVAVQAVACATLLTRVESLIGGMAQGEFVRRLRKAIAETISASQDVESIVQDSRSIVEAVLGRRLDEGTPFTIVDLDIKLLLG